jgi:hypothetical protein
MVVVVVALRLFLVWFLLLWFVSQAEREEYK